MRKHQILLWLGIVALTSCIKEVELVTPPFTSRLVVSSIMNPDSTIRVHIGQTLARTDTSSNHLSDALVLLYKNDISLDTLSYESRGWYFSTETPDTGSLYRIEVAHPSFPAVTSECLVPAPPVIDSVSFTVGEQLDKEGGPITRFTVVMDDPSNEINFYELILYSSNPSDPTVQPTQTSRIIQLDDPTLLSDSNWDFAPSTLFYSDALFNGQRGSISFNLKWGGYPTPDSPPYYLVIRNISPSYYHYLRSWSVHRFNQNTTFNTRDPLTLLFQGEPVELYTNVDQGYGIFGAYNEIQVAAQYVP